MLAQMLCSNQAPMHMLTHVRCAIHQVAEARAAARQQGAPPNVTCDTLVAPGALVCHMFWGSWRSSWGFGERHTYGDC